MACHTADNQLESTNRPWNPPACLQPVPGGVIRLVAPALLAARSAGRGIGTVITCPMQCVAKNETRRYGGGKG